VMDQAQRGYIDAREGGGIMGNIGRKASSNNEAR
jgi:hypothetical protein